MSLLNLVQLTFFIIAFIIIIVICLNWDLGKLKTFINAVPASQKDSVQIYSWASLRNSLRGRSVVIWRAMDAVKLYLWLCVTSLFVCGVLSVWTGQKCDSKHSEPVENPSDCNSYFLCGESNVYEKINCPKALYFSALHNQCKAANNEPCPHP